MSTGVGVEGEVSDSSEEVEVENDARDSAKLGEGVIGVELKGGEEVRGAGSEVGMGVDRGICDVISANGLEVVGVGVIGVKVTGVVEEPAVVVEEVDVGVAGSEYEEGRSRSAL